MEVIAVALVLSGLVWWVVHSEKARVAAHVESHAQTLSVLRSMAADSRQAQKDSLKHTSETVSTLVALHLQRFEEQGAELREIADNEYRSRLEADVQREIDDYNKRFVENPDLAIDDLIAR